MSTKILWVVLLLPFVYSFAVQEDSGASKPYFSYPRGQYSATGPRIIGGVEVTPHIYPFQASLVVVNSTWGYLCGGTLISKRWVLTAAHCVEMNPDYIIVGLGLHNLTDVEPTAIALNTTSYIGHEDWNRTLAQNDVAVVQLPYAVTFSKNIQPVKLASGSNQYVGDKATIVGWGVTETNEFSAVLKQVNTTILSNTDCANNYKEVIGNMHICTSGTGNVGACSGDSGGPLLVNGVQVGIMSFVTINCQQGAPSVFARVSTFHEWIIQNASDGAGTRDDLQMMAVVLVILCFSYLFK